MCAVVRLVSPLPISPSSRTATRWPALASMYAVVMPAMPAPTTQTSTFRFSLSGAYLGTCAVSTQIDVFEPDLLGIKLPPPPLPEAAGSTACATRFSTTDQPARSSFGNPAKICAHACISDVLDGFGVSGIGVHDGG